MDSIGWNGLAAVYHSQSSWSGRGAEPVMEKEEVKEGLRKHREMYGPPPPHFVRRETALAEIRLPPVELEGPLAGILKARMTARAFLKDRELPLEELGRILAGAFGTFGYEEAGDDLRFLKKTSPSAGGLHPVEAYPIVVRVAGVPPASITTALKTTRWNCWKRWTRRRRGR